MYMLSQSEFLNVYPIYVGKSDLLCPALIQSSQPNSMQMAFLLENAAKLKT